MNPVTVEPFAVARIPVHFIRIACAKIETEVLQDTIRDRVTTVCIEGVFGNVVLIVPFQAGRFLQLIFVRFRIDDLSQFRIFNLLHFPDARIGVTIAESEGQ